MLGFIPSTRDCTAEEQAARLLKSWCGSGREKERCKAETVLIARKKRL
jgi:hypothetical protein